MSTEISVLSDLDAEQLDRLEERIGAGMASFIEVGAALSAIRERKLYRTTHGTFEDYCREKWGMSRFYAHRVIEASETVAALPMGNKSAFTSERMVRELNRIEPGQRSEVVRRALANGGRLTTAAIKAAAKPASADFTQEAKSAGEEAESESEQLWRLKSLWKKTGKKDRAAFVEWIQQAAVLRDVGRHAEPQLAPTMPVELGAIGASTNGLMYARLAVAQLEKIERNDEQKADAFELVRNYLEGRPKP